MPQWTDRVPDTENRHAYDLKRTPPDSPLSAIVLSHDLLGCYTHYYGGHTVPCEAPNCPACDDNMPSRWHAYVAAWNPKDHSIFIFETTLKAAQALEAYRDTYGTLRGCFFCASRPKRRRNARVEIQTRPADLTKHNLPEPIDLKRALAVIWQLPPTVLETPSAEHSTPTVTPCRAVLDRVHARPPKPNGRPQE